MLLLIALVAVCVAWYLERNSRHEIAGTWYYPTRDINMMGYWETLTLNKDGTFTKFEQHRMSNETYSGTYTRNGDGTYYFDVIEKHRDRRNTHTDFESFKIGKRYRCRCSIDKLGYLLIKPLDFDVGSDSVARFPEDCYLDWHSYDRHSHSEQREMERQKVLAWLEEYESQLGNAK